ncbi:restriction endonuclease subunit S [Xanthomonas translucens]|uniref:Restriction endonuclease subunit S n=1 Tax=Xanthomonas translucens pv. translucens TaxID=134875 RepID=A0ABW9KWI5_XANCT|nr:restriction endonuclease subunit S [Xanthomonas translucens]MCS3360045.1 restriction endonuclease subunit S [Xanthomonas translucens pv. translucens]MCS3373982.1 restriction endonuclease subunit S [Xanthomonas translucens pv. translucens]MCT8289577.1 restriction endonuclease subunit S [Xanthomonas translucens pv. translucens]MCT8293302.1 restriction endonuclease subunit S [Xanthomonas translucens pv. translucens]MCT8313361.1 restriction endonuclease subunit S [Xanthomonas translucens pv. tr
MQRRKGHKMLPEDWRQISTGECADLLTGYAFSSQHYAEPNASTVRLLRGDNIVPGYLRWDDAKHWTTPYAEELQRYEMRQGDIVIAMDRPLVSAGLKCSVVQQHDLPCLLVQRVARLRAKSHVEQGYLTHLFQTQQFTQHLKGQKTETAVPHISPNDIRRFQLALPSNLQEQRRIAHILSTWDQAIATAEQQLASSRRYAEVLRNALLAGQRRFGDYATWQSKPLSEMIRESRVVGSGGDVAKKITVKLYGRGVVGKSDKRAGSESTRYYRRSAGQFIYSKLDFLNGAFGRIPAALDGYESTLDLPAFDFLPGVDPRWFLHYVSRETFYTGHLGLANGGRKARRVNPNDLLRISIPTPCLEEQARIADAIDTALSLVTTQERLLNLMREEKSALMSQLLTGKRRVRLPADEAASA